MKYPFTFTAIITDPTTSTGFSRESGMGFCDSFAEAANYIEFYYGKELITIKSLTLLEETPLIILPEETVKLYEETDYADYKTPCFINGNDLFVRDEDLPF
jgi:hypothetical protein